MRLAQTGADAGEELGRGEGLDEVVVGAAVQTFDAIRDGAAGGEHQNRRRGRAGGTQPSGDLEPIEVRHHPIEHDKVRVVSLSLGERIPSVRCGQNAVTLIRQHPAQHLCELGIVVSDQNRGHVLDAQCSILMLRAIDRPRDRSITLPRERLNNDSRPLGLPHLNGRRSVRPSSRRSVGRGQVATEGEMP